MSIVFAGWTCPRCRIFNGEEKERRESCRHCDGARPTGLVCPQCQGDENTALYAFTYDDKGRCFECILHEWFELRKLQAAVEKLRAGVHDCGGHVEITTNVKDWHDVDVALARVDLKPGEKL